MNHLILGLGGAGVRVWQALSLRLTASIEAGQGGRRLPVDVLLLDTDARALRDDAPAWRVLGQSVAPPASQRLLLEADGAALEALLQSRVELRGTVAPDGAEWEARLAQLGAFDAPLSQVGARLPGWPTRRLARLLLAQQQPRVRVALDGVVQGLQARFGDRQPLAIHVVAHLGGATGAGLLMDLLALLQRHPPAPRCTVHVHVELPDHDSAAGRPAPLADVQAYAVLRELQAAAQSGLFGLCFLGAMTDERGLQPLDAAGREARLADWLFHRVTAEGDWLMPPAPLRPTAPRPGEFVAYGVAERGADRPAIRSHLGHELMLRLLAQLRYNHWRPGLGFVAHPRPGQADPLPELLTAWGLSDAHLQLAVPMPEIDGDTPPAAPIEQEWQTLEAHYLGLLPLVPPARRLGELRRLFEQGLTERFRGQGIEAAFDLPDHLLRRRAVAVRQRVETQLWDDWRLGRRALHDCGQLLAAVLADLGDRIEPLRQEQRGLETQAALLVQQLDIKEQAAGGRFGALLRGSQRERDLAEAVTLLREYALARTRSAAVTLTLRLLAEIQGQLTTLQGMIDAGEEAVATLTEEIDAAAAATLPPATPEAGTRLDTRELLAHWRTQLVTRETMQREHLRVLRAGLFAQLGEQASFRIFAQRFGEVLTCDGLLAACVQRFPVAAIQSVAEAAWDAWMMRIHGEPDRMARELAHLRAQAAAGLAWSPHEALQATTQDLLRVPALPRTPDLQDSEADADAAAETAGDDGVAVAERVAPAEVATLPALAELIRPTDRAPLRVLEWPVGHGALALLRTVRGLSLQSLPRVQELHLRHEAHRLQAGRAALWLQLDDTAVLPELLTADVEAQKARARTVVLLAEALGLLREEIDPRDGRPVLLHVRLDDDGFELDRVRFGRCPIETVEQAESRAQVLHDLFDEVNATLALRDRHAPQTQAALRDVMHRRIDVLRTQSPPEHWDTINREWNEAARAAMRLVRQETAR
jgi:hypothetical protein